ncbi:MAG: T9SS type A sorting domain-containing protein [Flavobacteriaceae bacterium]|nr:T9SS type A sorting domain-containing protein [Flavobacteriaceae bacterium]
MTDKTDVLVHHGSTDAPVVDVVEVGVGAGTIVDNLAYSDFAGYLELPTANYRLAIKDETGSVTVVTYDAPLLTLGLGGAALTVVASGFLDPLVNSNGANFGLWVALASGGNLVELPIFLNVNENLISQESVRAYPNPANTQVIEYSLIENADLTIELYDILGQKVYESQQFGTSGTLNKYSIDVTGMNEGIYFLSLNAGASRITKKIQVVN